MVVRRSGRSGRRDSARTEPVAHAHRPARARGRAGRGARRVSRLFVRSRVLPVLLGVGRRVPSPDVAHGGGAGLLVPGPAAGPAGVGRAGGAVRRGARALARRQRAERAGGDQARGPHREPRLLRGPRRAARAQRRRAVPRPRSGVGGRAAEDAAVVELARPRVGRRPPRVHPGAVPTAARRGGPDGPRREPRRGQPLQHPRRAGRRHHRPRGRPHGDGASRRVRDQRRQPVHAVRARRAVGSRADDSAGPAGRRATPARRFRHGPVRHPRGDRLLRRRDRGALGDVHGRRHRPAVRRPPRARVPLPRLHRARAAADSGRRGHRGPAGDRGPHVRVPDHGDPGRPARVRRDLRRRPHPPRGRGADRLVHDRGGRLLPGRARGAERRARGGVAALHHRRAHRPGAVGHVRQAGARHHRQRHRGGVPGGPRRRRLRGAVAQPDLLGERRARGDGRAVRLGGGRAAGGLGRAHPLPRGVRPRARRLRLVLRQRRRQPGRGRPGRQERPLLRPDPGVPARLPRRPVAGRRWRRRRRRRGRRRPRPVRGPAAGHLRDLQRDPRSGHVHRRRVPREPRLPDPGPGAAARAGRYPGAAHEQPRHARRPRVPLDSRGPAAGGRGDAGGRGGAPGAGRRRRAAGRAARPAAVAAGRGGLRRGSRAAGRRRRRRGPGRADRGRGPRRPVRA